MQLVISLIHGSSCFYYDSNFLIVLKGIQNMSNYARIKIYQKVRKFKLRNVTVSKFN